MLGTNSAGVWARRVQLEHVPGGPRTAGQPKDGRQELARKEVVDYETNTL